MGRRSSTFQIDQELLKQSNSLSQTVHSEGCDQSKELEKVKSLYNRRNYKEALLQTAELIKISCSRQTDFQAYKLVGNIYDARREWANAVYFYGTALEFADTVQQQEVMDLSIKSASRMETDHILPLSKEVEEMFKVGGELLYGAGIVKFENGDDKEALILLKEYCSHYPEAGNIGQAKSVIKIIEARYAFHRHRIGVLLPLSGVYKTIGNNMLQALKLAVDEYNGQHKGARFQLIVRDSGANSKRAVTAVRELDRYKVSGIIGPLVSAEAAAREANKLEVPIIVLTQKEGIPAQGKFIFRNFLTPRMQVEAIVAYLMGEKNIRRFAVLHPDDKYGRSFTQAFVKMVDMYEGEITDVESYTPGQTDFAVHIKSFIRGYHALDKNGKTQFISTSAKRKRHGNYTAIVDFEALFLPDSVKTVKLIAPQLPYNDITGMIIAGTNMWQSEDIDSIVDEAYARSAIFSIGFDASSHRLDINRFVKDFEAQNDRTPGFMEAVAYDTCKMMMNSLSQPEVRSRQEFSEKLLSIENFKGITGVTFFDPVGEAVKKLNVVQISNEQ